MEYKTNKNIYWMYYQARTSAAIFACMYFKTKDKSYMHQAETERQKALQLVDLFNLKDDESIIKSIDNIKKHHGLEHCDIIW